MTRPVFDVLRLSMTLRTRVLVLAFVASLVTASAFLTTGVWQSSAAERSAQAGTVTITVLASSTPVAGAFVALTGATGQYSAISNSSGIAEIVGVADGAYDLAASATNFAVSTRSLTVAGIAVSQNLTLTASPSPFTSLNAFGAQTGTIVADGKTGVFYLNTTTIPSLFRTADYGGNWVPVATTSDDPTNGIDGTATVGGPTTSGFPGEIAASVGSKVWYSRDFGVTWKSFNISPAIGQTKLHWSHVGNTSVLFAVDDASTSMWFTNMPTFAASTVTPAFTAVTNSYKAKATDRVWLANGGTTPMIAVAAGDGVSVKVYAVGATPNATTDPSSTIATGVPATTPTFVRIGGPVTGPAISVGNQSPNTVIAYSSSGNGSGVLSTYTSGAWVSTIVTEFKQQESETTDAGGRFSSGGSNSCGASAGAGAIGSVSPLGGAGSISQCWVSQASGSTTLVARFVRNINNNTGMAFDAGYDGLNNLVLLSGDGGYGLVKSAKQVTDLNRPDFPGWPVLASAGTASNSGGIALNGVNAGVVRDVTFGNLPNQMAIIFSSTGGNRVLGSTDRGTIWFTLLPKGGSALDWWRGSTAGKHWIMSSANGAGNLISVAELTATGISTSTTLTTINSTASSDLGLTGTPENTEIPAVIGMPGTDAAWVAATDGTTSTLRKVTMTSATTVTISSLATRNFEAQALSSLSKRLSSLAYCPTTGSATVVANVLFGSLQASTANGTDGGLVKVTGASTSSPTQTVLTTVTGDFRDVRVQCAQGIIWAAKYANPPSGPPTGVISLVKLTDGGTTFTSVTAPASGSLSSNLQARFSSIETFTINQDDANEVLVVSGSGDMISTADGGTTWTARNDSTSSTGKAFGNEKPGDIALPPATATTTSSSSAQSSGDSERSAQATTPVPALFGSGGGLFSAAVRGSTETTPTATVVATATATTQSTSRGRLNIPILPRNLGGW